MQLYAVKWILKIHNGEYYMLVDQQLVEVKIGTKNFQHYKHLGYDVRIGDSICVPVEHLTDGSHAMIQLICDVCGTRIERAYYDYLQKRKSDIVEMDVCLACKNKKTEQSNLIKYGTACVFQSESIKNKIKDTNLQKYGVENPFQSEDIKDKIKSTCLNKYGAEYFSQTDMHKIKTKQTCMERYGVEFPNQSPEVKEKSLKTFAQNESIKTSTQQRKVYEIIQKKYPEAILNYAFSNCLLDVFVCVNNIKLDIEYDGWFWHQDQQQDIKRDKFLQSNGFKTLRIRSGHLVPDEHEIFDAIDELVTTQHCFREIILPDWKGNLINFAC